MGPEHQGQRAAARGTLRLQLVQASLERMVTDITPPGASGLAPNARSDLGFFGPERRLGQYRQAATKPIRVETCLFLSNFDLFQKFYFIFMYICMSFIFSTIYRFDFLFDFAKSYSIFDLLNLSWYFALF